MRHKLVQRIVEAYREHAEETGTERSRRVLTVEVDNRSGGEVDEGAAVELAGACCAAEGIEDGELGLAFVGPEEMRALKREHLGIDEATDVLSFPIDGRDELPDGLPRALGDVVALPAGRRRGVARAARRTGCCTCSATTTATEMERARSSGQPTALVSAAVARDAARVFETRSTTRSRGSSTCSARSGTCGSTSRSRRSCSCSRSSST